MNKIKTQFLNHFSNQNAFIAFKWVICIFVILNSSQLLTAQNFTQKDSLPSSKSIEAIEKKHSLGISLFMLSNFFPDPADYYLLTYGYQFTKKDRVFAEFNTWKYAEPLGTYGNSDKYYPGFVRSFGIGAGYQRFHWKGLYTAIQATPFLKHYYDENNDKIQNGFQLYIQVVGGYRIEFFKRRIYVEPAYALKYWPIDTNFPSDFAEIEKGKPKYIFEFSANVGYKF